MSRGGTSAPLEDELCRLEVRVVFAIGKKRLIDSQRRSWTSPPKLGPRASLGSDLVFVRWGQTWFSVFNRESIWGGKAFGDTHKVKRQVSQLIGEHLGKALGGEALGDTHKPEAISPSLMPFTLEHFLLLRQIVVNCFNSKDITSVHLNP